MDRSAAAPPTVPHPPPDSALPIDSADFGSLPDPSDDTPTIITKQMPRVAAQADAATTIRGRQLAHFELIEPIGVGGMAAVIRARDTQLDRQVALKILPPEMAKDPENVQRFHQEARSAARLDHENIARVFFCGEDQKLHFIAFEFVEGQNLRNLLERRGRLPVEEALHYVIQVAAGLTHASQRGVVHRDIKPSNIIITPTGRAKLVDMGLARSLEPQHDLGLTQSGVTLGSFDYISPEQALEPRDADVRSDIYSLGCTFYHMLTGQPPVPEGTAAKKLHHHQHVKPLDPRQYVPDLPYEAAAILDRMMAKEPKNRFQTPEELVHHLLLAAKKLGAIHNVPEGVLSLETTLPRPPGTRPLFVAGMAALTIVILVSLLGKGEPGGNPFFKVIQPGKSSDNGKAAHGGAEVVEKQPPKDANPAAIGKDKDVAKPKRVTFESKDGNVAELVKFLADNKGADRMEIVLAHDLVLPLPETATEPGLVMEAREVIIRGSDKAHRPTIRLSYTISPHETRQAALTVKADRSTLQDLRVLVAGQGAQAEMTGVFFQGGKEHVVESCEFIQVRASFHEQNRMASVVAEAGTGQKPNVKFDGCCFLGFGDLEDKLSGPREAPAYLLTSAKTGGQDAIVRRGPVKVTATNCAFGPHRATFRFEEKGDEPFAVQHCSVIAYAAPSSVFYLAGGASAAVDVQDSLFSRLGPKQTLDAMDNPERVALIRQTSASDPLSFRDVRNRYHQFDDYRVTAEGVTDWAAFQREVNPERKPSPGEESREQKGETPWKGQPFEQLEKQEFAAAFQVNNELASLLVNGSVVGPSSLLGVTFPKPQPKPAGPRELVVNPDVNDDSASRKFKTLEQAIVFAEKGDVIRLQHNGDLPVVPIAWKKEDLNLTIRAGDGYRPRLTLGETRDRETALFTLKGGKLRLEGLEFLLKPDQDEFDAQAVVAIAGNGQCEFKDCLITLSQDRKKAVLSLATVAAPAGVMSQEARQPQVSLDHCFVRGEGDLVWARHGRPVGVKAENSLIALTGSLLNVEAKEESADKKLIEINLTKTTTYLGGYLIRVQAGNNLKGLIPIVCDPDHCLLLPSSMEKSLVHLDGPTAKDEVLTEKLTWKKKANAYGNFQSLFDQQTPDGPSAAPPMMGSDKWRQFTGEGTNSKYGVKLLAGPAADGSFPLLTPNQFKPMDATLKDFGADLAALRERLLPDVKE